MPEVVPSRAFAPPFEQPFLPASSSDESRRRHPFRLHTTCSNSSTKWRLNRCRPALRRASGMRSSPHLEPSAQVAELGRMTSSSNAVMHAWRRPPCADFPSPRALPPDRSIVPFISPLTLVPRATLADARGPAEKSWGRLPFHGRGSRIGPIFVRRDARSSSEHVRAKRSGGGRRRAPFAAISWFTSRTKSGSRLDREIVLLSAVVDAIYDHLLTKPGGAITSPSPRGVSH